MINPSKLETIKLPTKEDLFNMVYQYMHIKCHLVNKSFTNQLNWFIYLVVNGKKIKFSQNIFLVFV
ncbi:MAG TPA: hypothetical protein DDY13_18275 [Cytophagales bacterium]|nr:hypothetical protein [Cytophagales bacterium]